MLECTLKMKSVGFVRGKYAPAVFRHQRRDFRCVVHGSDSFFAGRAVALVWAAGGGAVVRDHGEGHRGARKEGYRRERWSVSTEMCVVQGRQVGIDSGSKARRRGSQEHGPVPRAKGTWRDGKRRARRRQLRDGGERRRRQAMSRISRGPLASDWIGSIFSFVRRRLCGP